MSQISTNLNLRQLKHVTRTLKNKDGKTFECLILPIEENNLVVGEKGIYINLIGFELREKKADRKDTHLVKQSLPKEIYEAMSEEEKKDVPILGNHVLWSGQGEAQPQQSNNIEPTEDFDSQEFEDLPF